MYRPEGKTIKQVIQETRLLMKEKEVTDRDPNAKYYYLKKYTDCTSILTSWKKSRYYVGCLNDIYGPFTSTKEAKEFREVLRINQEAHQQAMWKSWESDPVLS